MFRSAQRNRGPAARGISELRNKVLHRASFDSEYVRRLKEGDHATEQHFTSYFGELLLIKLRARMLPPQTVRTSGRRPSFGCSPH